MIYRSSVAQRCLAFVGVVGWMLVSSGCGILSNLEARRARASQQQITAPIAATLSAEDFASELAETRFSDSRRKRLDRLRRLSEVFYNQLLNRRINSKAVFDDPSLREFFESNETFADYYADLVQSLANSHFDAIRPTSITLESFAIGENADSVHVRVHFVGENRLPLRFWKTSYVRVDHWVVSGRKWWISPGRV